MTTEASCVIGGVHTHKHTHYGAVIDDQGGLLGHGQFPVAELPKGVCVEPCGGCVVSVYQEVAQRHSAEIRGKRFASSASSGWVAWFALLVMFQRTPLGNCWTSEWPPNAGVKRATNRPSPCLNS
jgi:hypothetical protein